MKVKRVESVIPGVVVVALGAYWIQENPGRDSSERRHRMTGWICVIGGIYHAARSAGSSDDDSD